MNAVTRRSGTLDAVEGFAAAAERFAVAVAWSDLRARVPSCPGWSTYDLVVHLGNVHAWAATILETGRAAVEQNDEPRSSTRSKSVSAWYVGKAGDLYAVLRHSDPDAPCWNFVHGSGPASFWARRQLHETTMHQVDLAVAREQPTDLDPLVCADGVDEVLTAMMHRMHHRGHPAVLDEALALEATDTGDTWVVSPRGPEDSPVPLQPVGSAHAPGAAAPPTVARSRRRDRARDAGAEPRQRIEAPADVLYRMLWHRPVADAELRVTGDETRVQDFLGSRLTP